MESIYKRWGMTTSPEEEWKKLKSRLKVLFGTPRVQASKTTVEVIAFTLGKDVIAVGGHSSFNGSSFIETERIIDRCVNSFELADALEALIMYMDLSAERKDLILNVVNKSQCGIHMKSTDDGIITYPSGEKELDEKIVDATLSFLGGESAAEYTKALERYSQGKWEECAEKTRRTLEEYLRSLLANTKGLSANIEELGRFLAGSDSPAPQHLRSTLLTLLKTLDKNYNESSKHNSQTFGEAESEFLIYQTGLLMRVMSKLPIATNIEVGQNDNSAAEK